MIYPLFLKLAAGVLAAAWLGSAETRAADFVVQGGHTLLMKGEIKPGDAGKFTSAIAGGNVTVLSLESFGGYTIDALAIGNLVRKRSIHTVVSEKIICASSCALIWLAGTALQMDRTSKIGFHASFDMAKKSRPAIGWANAIVGAYLSRLGYSDRLIYLATSAPPTGIHWLTEADIEQANLTVTVYPLKKGGMADLSDLDELAKDAAEPNIAKMLGLPSPNKKER